MSIRHAAALAAAALIVLVPARRVQAQPACDVATAATYMQQGFACRLGDWRLSHFSFNSDLSLGAAGTGSVAGASFQLRPFVATSPGALAFGFDFEGLDAEVRLDPGPGAYRFADASLSFAFRLTALDPQLGIAGARVVGVQRVQSVPTTPLGAGSGESGILASVDAMFGEPDNTCLDVRRVATTATDAALDVAQGCQQPPLPRRAIAAVNLWAQGWHQGVDDVPGSVGARTALTRLELRQGASSTVPEPATVALVAPGAALVLAAAVRRRRARAGTA